MNEQAIRFRLGVFVLAALLLLAVLITLFGGFPHYFVPSTTYTVIFSTALGVAPGTPVQRSGVKIGEVRKVTLENDTGKVDVIIQVEDGFILRKGDKATLLQGLLGGDTAIAFLPPPEGQPVDATPVEPGTVLLGFSQADTGTVLQKTADLMTPAKGALVNAEVVFQEFKELTPELKEAIKEFRIFAKSMNQAMPELRQTNKAIRELAEMTHKSVPELEKTNKQFQDLAKMAEKQLPRLSDELQLTARTWTKFTERLDNLVQANEDKLIKTLEQLQITVLQVNKVLSDENQKAFSNTLKNVSVSSNRLDGIARNTEEFLRESRTTIKQLNDSLVKADETLSNLQKASKPLADRGDSIVKNLDESTDKLNKVLADVRDIMHAVSRNDGTVQRLLSDPSLYNNVNEAAGTVSRMIPRLDRILRDVEIFADKIARHPEVLGAGGVVRPGTGLKESPTPYKITPLYP